MRALHIHHGPHVRGHHHDARPHQSGRATPWFVLAVIAFVTAIKVG